MNCAEKLLEPQSSSIYRQSQVKIRFRKSLAQERFKSNLEPRHQTTVSSIKPRNWLCEAYDTESPVQEVSEATTHHELKSVTQPDVLVKRIS